MGLFTEFVTLTIWVREKLRTVSHPDTGNKVPPLASHNRRLSLLDIVDEHEVDYVGISLFREDPRKNTKRLKPILGICSRKRKVRTIKTLFATFFASNQRNSLFTSYSPKKSCLSVVSCQTTPSIFSDFDRSKSVVKLLPTTT